MLSERCLTPFLLVSDASSNNEKVSLACKRNRQDGVSGTPFRTTTIVKYLNTRRVRGQRRPLFVQ
ncbi:MAG: hypothetical protein LBK25_00715 [Treponema sp.]|nr:hypothetical protein [Treponema sp.]